MEYLLTFPNTHYAILAGQVLLARKVAVRVFTLLPSFTDDCGVGLLTNETEITHGVCFLEETKVRVASIFSVKNNPGEKKYQLWSPQKSVLIYKGRGLCQLLVMAGKQA